MYMYLELIKLGEHNLVTIQYSEIVLNSQTNTDYARFLLLPLKTNVYEVVINITPTMKRQELTIILLFEQNNIDSESP